MVTKRGKSKTENAKRKFKVGKLSLNKETVKQLSDSETRKVKGGAAKEKCKTFNLYTCV